MIVSYKSKKLTSTNINLLTSDSPFFLIQWSNSTLEGKWGDLFSRYWPTTDPNVKCNNFSKQTTKKKQAASFSSPPRPRRPSSSILIDGQGFGA
jgi:hypothetical protein